MDNSPKVSVIIPSYNAEKYIAECVISVVNQTHSNLEIIIIDDGSTDSTKTCIEKIIDPRIKYFKQTNQGVSAARNKGLQIAEGDYICTLDADDIMPVNSISSRIKIAQENPEINIIDGTVYTFINGIDNSRLEWSPSFRGNPYKELLFLKSTCFYGSTWMIRKDLIDQKNYNTEMTHGEDLAFYMDIAKNGEYSYTEEPILFNRRHEKSAMNNMQGLENGYHYLIEKIKNTKQLTSNEFKSLKLKVAKMMFKSYFKKNQFISGIKAYISFRKK